MRTTVPDDAVRPSVAMVDPPPVLHWSSKGGAHATPETREERTPCRSPKYGSTAIPRVVWTYWNGTPLPRIVDACLLSWRRHLTGYRVRLLGPDSLPSGLPPLPRGFALWAPQVQSDWVRLAVLTTFGGVWMDATTLLSSLPHTSASADDKMPSSPLSFVEALDTLDRPDLVGYFNSERTYDTAYPMLENWFLAAPARSVFMMHWFHTFSAMLMPDGRSDIDHVVNGLTIPALLQGFSHAPQYFACHAAAQWVMRQHGGRLALIPAELDAFLEPHSRGWDSERVCNWLCDASADGKRPSARPLTKLISLLWRPLEERLQRGDFHRESILGELGSASHA
jgi:Capsular polysaccharide synthesis protein